MYFTSSFSSLVHSPIKQRTRVKWTSVTNCSIRNSNGGSIYLEVITVHQFRSFVFDFLITVKWLQKFSFGFDNTRSVYSDREKNLFFPSAVTKTFVNSLLIHNRNVLRIRNVWKRTQKKYHRIINTLWWCSYLATPKCFTFEIHFRGVYMCVFVYWRHRLSSFVSCLSFWLYAT